MVGMSKIDTGLYRFCCKVFRSVNQNRRQRVFHRKALRLCRRAWHSKNWQNSTGLQCSLLQFGGAWNSVWGAKAHQSAPWRRDCGKWLFICFQTFQKFQVFKSLFIWSRKFQSSSRLLR